MPAVCKSCLSQEVLTSAASLQVEPVSGSGNSEWPILGGASGPSPAGLTAPSKPDVLRGLLAPAFLARAGHTTFTTIPVIPLTAILFQKASNGRVRGKKRGPLVRSPWGGSPPSRESPGFSQGTFSLVFLSEAEQATQPSLPRTPGKGSWSAAEATAWKEVSESLLRARAGPLNVWSENGWNEVGTGATKTGLELSAGEECIPVPLSLGPASPRLRRRALHAAHPTRRQLLNGRDCSV